TAIDRADLGERAATLPPAPDALAGYCPSPRAIRTLMTRWQRTGAVAARGLVVGRPRIVRLTRTGAAMVGVEFFRETAEATAYHQCEVSRLRLHLQARPSPSLGRLTQWESE